jgi:glycosyltransferase involved in cell wall biosynthesis
LLHARGEYLATLDDDDMWHPDKLMEQVKLLDENKELDIVMTRMILKYE